MTWVPTPTAWLKLLLVIVFGIWALWFDPWGALTLLGIPLLLFFFVTWLAAPKRTQPTKLDRPLDGDKSTLR